MNRLEKEKNFHNNRFSEENRVKTQKFYSITKNSKSAFDELVFDNIKDKTVLEIGCAKGEYANVVLKHNPKKYVGIDISDVAVSKSYEINNEYLSKIEFLVMDGADLSFQNNSFDKIFGHGVLHHLDYEKAIKNIVKVLKQDGEGIFFEPLGHNPLINLYRKLTPNLRTEDETPLKIKDLNFIKSNFRKVDIKYYYLFEILTVLFRNTIFFNLIKIITSYIDKMLFKITFLQKYAWIVVIKFSNPIK